MKSRNIVGLILAVLMCCSLVSCNDKGETMSCPECELIPEVGLCNAAFPKYYFDQNEGKCKEFIWGGCGGTVPFNTMQECLDCDCQ